MIKIQIGTRIFGEQEEKREFTVYLRFTDGIEPIFVSNKLWDVAVKIKEIQKAIPQTTNYEVEFI